MTRRLLRSAAACLAVAAGVVSFPADGQGACDATEGDTSNIEGSLTAPTVDAVVDAALTIAVTGSGFRYTPVLLSDIDRAQVELVACEGQPLPAGSSFEQDYGGDDRDGRSFSWTTPELAWNGRYAVRATIVADNDRSRTIVRPFAMDRPATAPEGVRAEADGSGTVSVSWDPPPSSEPDVVAYVVEWVPQNADDFEDAEVAEVTGDAAPATGFSHEPGVGEWRYRVTALRAGRGGDDLNSSAPSAAVEAEVVAAVASTTTSAPPAGSGSAAAGGGSPAGAGATAAGRTAGNADLSNFSRLLEQRRAQARTPDAAPRPAEPPDPGFDETLPFAPREGRPAEAAGAPADAPELSVQELGDDDGGEERRLPTFVAASMLLAVLAYGIRLLGRAADMHEMEPAEPAPAHEAAAAPEPAAAATAAGAVEYDVTSELPPPLDETPIAEAPATAPPLGMPVARPVAATDAPHLDVVLPARRARRSPVDEIGTDDAGRTARRVPSRPRPDRGAGGEVVRARRRGVGGGDGRAPVG
ncbi:MAG TPA: fibronectin type III domain-containing protein [Acidimicrobiales bacterium]|nr:fibronectin type III domain-containing protein [Acidimicrobiales bacterium]